MRTKRDDETPSIQMEPMIDCVFLLLIFFLVAATIRKKHHELPIELPIATAAVAKKPTDDCIIISIYGGPGTGSKEVVYRLKTFKDTLTTSGGKQEDISRNDLRLAIQGFSPEQMIRIDADHRVPYGSVSEIIDMLQRSGCMKFGLRTMDPQR